MPFQIIRQDITTVVCDAIVNPTDRFYSGSGGTDRAVHFAAGRALADACTALSPLSVGEVALTDAFALPCRYIIHTCGPVWTGGEENEGVLLRACYLNALLLAVSLGAETVAVPLISSGTFGFPKDRVLRIAAEAISDFLLTADSEPEVLICIPHKDAYALGCEIALREFLGNSAFSGTLSPCSTGAFEPVAADCYAGEWADAELPLSASDGAEHPAAFSPPAPKADMPKARRQEKARPPLIAAAPMSTPDLHAWLLRQDDSFAVTLLKLIDRSGMTDVECYKKANVSKKTFWKINNDPDYRPSKPTVLAFAIALHLSLPETESLLRTVGFSLSHSSVFDMIIEFHITNGIYDVFEINAALYQYDQPCLGC